MVWWLLLLIVSIGVFFAAQTVVLPRFFLQNHYAITQSRDRGIKRYRTETEVHSVVYEPSPEVRPYVRQYIITDDGTKKLLRCKLDPAVDYLDYDIALFNNRNRVFDVLSIQEVIDNKGLSESVELPPETSYASILLNSVNRQNLGQSVRLKLSGVKLLWFVLASVLVSVLVAFGVKLSCSRLFGGVFRESYMSSLGGTVTTLLLALVLAVLGGLLVALVLWIKTLCMKKR